MQWQLYKQYTGQREVVKIFFFDYTPRKLQAHFLLPLQLHTSLKYNCQHNFKIGTNRLHIIYKELILLVN